MALLLLFTPCVLWKHLCALGWYISPHVVIKEGDLCMMSDDLR